MVGVVKFATVKVSENVVSMVSLGRLVVSILRSLISITPSTSVLNLPHEFGFELTITDRLHHGEMFKIIVRLEKGISSEKLH